jgi:hypothetical protein
LIDGNDDGQAGGNAVAILTKQGATVNALTGGSAAFDMLVANNDLTTLSKTRKS